MLAFVLIGTARDLGILLLSINHQTALRIATQQPPQPNDNLPFRPLEHIDH